MKRPPRKPKPRKQSARQPMRSFVNADSVDYRCPCGDSFEGEGDAVQRFIDAHKAHSNGKCVETITPSGMRFLAPGTRTFKL